MRIDISNRIGTTSNFGGFRGLLDKFSGAAAAYSLRKLSKATTSVVRVRRDSDNAEADFTALEITDGTLEAWVNTQVERTTNGDFDTDTDWTKGTGWSIADGKASSDGSQTTYSSLYQSGLAIGQTHNFTMTITDYVSGSVLLRNGIGTPETYISAKSANGTYTGTAVVDGGGTNPTLVISASPDFIGSVSFVSAIQTTADGLVTTWYDQSGNANNATQATAAAQPQIVDGGSLITENGKVALDFDGTDDGLAISNFQTSAYVNMALFSVINATDTTGVRTIFSKYDFTNDERSFTSAVRDGEWSSNVSQNGTGVILRVDSSDNSPSGYNLFSNLWDLSETNEIDRIDFYRNGSLASKTVETSNNITSAFNANANFEIGSQGVLSISFFEGIIQEVIFYPSDQSGNRVSIESAINGHYNIYP